MKPSAASPKCFEAKGESIPVTVGTSEQSNFSEVYLGSGSIETRSHEVHVLLEQLVVRVHVDDGDYVEKGQLLAELDDLPLQRKVEREKIQLTAALIRLSRVEAGGDPRDHPLRSIGRDVESPETFSLRQAEISVARAEHELEFAQQNEAIYRAAWESNIVTEIDYRERQLNLTRARHNLDFARKSLDVTKSVSDLDARLADAAVKSARLELERAEMMLKRTSIRAPVAGLIVSRSINPGEFAVGASTGSGLVAFVITADRWFKVRLDQLTVDNASGWYFRTRYRMPGCGSP